MSVFIYSQHVYSSSENVRKPTPSVPIGMTCSSGTSSSSSYPHTAASTTCPDGSRSNDASCYELIRARPKGAAGERTGRPCTARSTKSSVSSSQSHTTIVSPNRP
jgi:hypothetical protein